jgi:quinoprotein glucose dehydrogenase
MLYVAIGDYYQPALAANPASPIGSILRVMPDGTIPPDNPAPNNPVWAYGFRNPRGMAWHQPTGRLFVADNGTSLGDQVRVPDRIIAVEKGAFHGWGTDPPAGATVVEPIVTFDRPSPPGDIAFFDGSLFVSVLGFNTVGAQSLIKVSFEDPTNPVRVTSQERWFTDDKGGTVYGRLRAMTVGPDGSLYVSTSNRDGRTMERPQGHDLILKITRK